jgi:hypothetical protein
MATGDLRTRESVGQQVHTLLSTQKGSAFERCTARVMQLALWQGRTQHIDQTHPGSVNKVHASAQV